MVPGLVIGESQSSTVSDWKKLIRDFRDQFPYNAVTALIVETFANSIDAKATKIFITCNNETYTILDNGNGMSENDFRQYHNMASVTKERGQGIGFAGVGAKTFLDRAKSTLTETKSISFHGNSYWAFSGDELKWTPIQPLNKISFSSGTYVEVQLQETADLKTFSQVFIIETLQKQFNAILLGLYGKKEVFVNDQRVNPFNLDQTDIEHLKEFDIRLGGKVIKGFIKQSKRPLPEDFQGPYIVVHGKTVNQNWFKQTPFMSETFYGLIRADYLIDILRTSKSDFERTTQLWKKFQARVGKEISNWLDEIHANPPKQSISKDLDRVTNDFVKDFNDMLNLPEFQVLSNNFFQNVMQRNIAITSKNADELGIDIDGVQITSGSIGKTDTGEGVITAGNDEGTGIVQDDQGEKPIERVRRLTKGGIKIGYVNNPDELLEAWVDPGSQTITINKAMPAWKIAYGLSHFTQNWIMLYYYLLRSVAHVIIDESGINEEQENKRKFMELLFAWYRVNIPENIQVVVEAN
jgi:hypothetical protein